MGFNPTFRPQHVRRFGSVLAAVMLAGIVAAPAGAMSTGVITVNTNITGFASGDNQCTIDEAVQNANNDAATNTDCAAGHGKDTIKFNISGPGVHFIQNQAISPDWLIVTKPVIIDGTTESGYFDDYVPHIHLDNNDNTGSIIVLAAGSNGSVIKGLAFGNSQSAGILADRSSSHTFLGNYFNVDGMNNYVALSGNGLTYGIELDTSKGNKIGGPSSVPGNSNFFGHLAIGVYISSGDKNVIKGNYIGMSPTTLMGNSTGIFISAGAGNVIGGTGPYDGNIISNNGNGVILDGLISKTVIERNIVGLTASGMTNAANSLYGIWSKGGATRTSIGSSKPGSGNVISANPGGVYILDGTGHVVAHNIFGLTKAGTSFNLGSVIALNLAGSASATVADNIFADQTPTGIGVELDAASTTTSKSTGNCFFNNNTAVYANSTGMTNLPKAWWDSAMGPNNGGEQTTGTGPTNFANFLTAAPASCVAPAQPVLVKPIATGVFFSTQPTLSWKAIKGVYGYEVQISPVGDFSSITTDTIVTKPSYSVKKLKGVPAPFGVWYWRVQALGPNGIPSGYASGATYYQVILHKSPKNYTNLSSNTVKLVWNKEPNSTSYSLTWDTSPSSSSPTTITGITVTTYMLTLPGPGDYMWSIHPNAALTNPPVTIPGMGMWIFTVLP